MLRAQLRNSLYLLAITLGCLAPATQTQAQSSAAPCAQCIQIRVGLPRVVRGPSSTLPDNHFSELRLPDGHFRGFIDGGHTSNYVDGTTPWDMGGNPVQVLGAGPDGTYDSCGQWIASVAPYKGGVLGWVHNETACNHKIGQTHKSMSVALSMDNGQSWQDRGQIITGSDTPTDGKATGQGDCTSVDGQDGYFYAYCARAEDRRTIALRASKQTPWSGNWFKLLNGNWSEPGLAGNSTPLAPGTGTASAWWSTANQTLLVGNERDTTRLFLSSNHTDFTALPEPLLPNARNIWRRPDPTELIAYTTLINANDGSSNLGNQWLLVYVYLQPNDSFHDRYMVFRPVDVTISPTPITPQVGVLLARWYSSSQHDRWSTTAAVPGNYTTYAPEGSAGYLMTAADPTHASVALEDCVQMQSNGQPAHMLAQQGVCETMNYQALRTAGWVYSQQQNNSQPLYQCYSAADNSHFASISADCDGLGTKQNMLGYDLIK